MSNGYRQRRVRSANSLPQADWAQLIHRCRQSDDSAFDVLFGLLWPDVLAFARHLLRRKSDAEDVASETMFAMWTQASSFEGKSCVKTWVIGILINKVSHMNRKSKRHQEVMVPMLLEDFAADGDNTEEQLIKQQEASQVKVALAALSSAKREVIYGHYFLDRSLADVAAQLQIQTGTVKSRLNSGRAELRIRLDAPPLPKRFAHQGPARDEPGAPPNKRANEPDRPQRLLMSIEREEHEVS